MLGLGGSRPLLTSDLWPLAACAKGTAMALGQNIEQIRPTGKVRLSKRARREEIEFYLFISLWIIGFIAFDAGPIIASFVISFTDWSALSAPHWVGPANYQHMLIDPLFYKA